MKCRYLPSFCSRKQKNMEAREINSGSSVTSNKKFTKHRSFHFRYLELCRAKNISSSLKLCSKNNSTTCLDFFGDKLSVTDWLLVIEALYNDQILQTLAIRIRKGFGLVLEHLDTENKARLFKQKPVVFTKYIFVGLVRAISNCIEFNTNLKTLCLEALPLVDKYVDSIAKSISSNESIKELSFQRSKISDKGCEVLCHTIKYLENIEVINFSGCDLTCKGAEHVANMIKVQKITRYTDGWQKSLRYRDVNPDLMSGLRSINLSRNPKIGDDGIKLILEVLKEDVWIKSLEMEDCGITDRGGNLVLDCLEVNHYISEVNVRNNEGISKFLLTSIRENLGKEDEDQKLLEAHLNIIEEIDMSQLPRRAKVTVNILKEQLKTLEDQLSFERVLRQKAEQLNEKLNEQIIAYEKQLEYDANARIPKGYVVVKNDSLQSIIRERNEFEKLATMVVNQVASEDSAPGMYTDEPYPMPHQSQPQPLSLEPRKGLKVRKVKSEMKYVDPIKDTKRKESKSDHELTNETDFKISDLQIEKNIGDSAVINSNYLQCDTLSQQIIEHKGQITSYLEKNFKNVISAGYGNDKFEMEPLSICSSRTVSDEPTDSETLRNDTSYVPKKGTMLNNQKEEYGQGDQGSILVKSPRSLFMGL